MTSARRSTGSVRRLDVLLRTLFVSQVHLKGSIQKSQPYFYHFFVDTDECDGHYQRVLTHLSLLRCAKNGYTSRWYHLSCGEHFCNECFDHYYRR